MKIKLSKSQWEGIGKKAGWMKRAMLTNLLETIKMQGGEGLNIGSMSFEELQDAKQYEKTGVIIKKDNKYFVNSDYSPDFEKSKKYMEDLNGDVSKRRSVKVTMSDGDTITTEINGTKKEIEDYYLKNDFVKSDEKTMHRGVHVEFLD